MTISFGRSITTGPGRPVRAMWKAFFIVIANLVVDILYAVVDPSVRT